MGKEAGKVLSMTSPVFGIAGGIYSAISGAKEKRDADKMLAEYNRQPLENIAENLQVSTRGADVATENQARLEANQVDALRGGGTRALVAGLGRVEAGSQAVAENIGANLDQQQKDIDQMKAQDDARIRAIQENREIADISALSSQSQAGKDAMYMGFGNIIQGAGEVGNKIGSTENKTQNRELPMVENSLSPSGKTISTIPTADTRYFENPQFQSSGFGMFKRRNPYLIPN